MAKSINNHLVAIERPVVLTFDADTDDATITYDEDNNILNFGGSPGIPTENPFGGNGGTRLD